MYLERDAGRYVYCRERLNFCPLGACALAGTGLPIDRFMTATALGFTQPMRNSIDAVSDRDFVLEFLKQYNASEEESRPDGACQRKVCSSHRRSRHCPNTLQGTSLAYNRDFQEDKEPMFDSTKTIMGMGMPFRSSHDVVGKLVGVCVSRGCELQNLSLEEMKKLSPVFEEDVFGFWESEILLISSVPTGQLDPTVSLSNSATGSTS
ncbi:hypothetical protein Bca52824_003715 [Brassica carinata]|uniref:Argininosuccinate lyase n=1 Tax=Brassica carinata TaxID=52824 RepID=A0A8X7WPB9_BRACI|nr:hypothetical protein Bca52824_003715 [Brassica carinata]